MYLSLSTHLFVYHEFDTTFIDIAAESGVRAMEIFAVNPHFPYRDRRFVGKVMRRCEKRDIRIVSVHSPLYMHIDDIRKNRWFSLSSEDEELRERTIEETIAASMLLTEGEEGILVVHTSIPGEERGGPHTFLFLDSVKRILEKIPRGVRVAIENSTTSSGTAMATIDIAGSFPAGRVGVCIDVGHAHVGESAPSAIMAASNRLLNVHCSDNEGDEDDHLIPGEGTLDWHRVIKALRSAAYEGPLTMEIRDTLRGIEKDYSSFGKIIERSISFLTGIVEHHGG